MSYEYTPASSVDMFTITGKYIYVIVICVPRLSACTGDNSRAISRTGGQIIV